MPWGQWPGSGSARTAEGAPVDLQLLPAVPGSGNSPPPTYRLTGGGGCRPRSSLCFFWFSERTNRSPDYTRYRVGWRDGTSSSTDCHQVPGGLARWDFIDHRLPPGTGWAGERGLHRAPTATRYRVGWRGGTSSSIGYAWPETFLKQNVPVDVSKFKEPAIRDSFF